MTETVRVGVAADDAITAAGIVSTLERDSAVTVIAGVAAPIDVCVVATGSVSSGNATLLRAAASDSGVPLVLLAEGLLEEELLLAVECRVVAILPRGAAVDGRLADAVRTAAEGGGAVPPDLLGHLLRHLRDIDRELPDSGVSGRNQLSDRETEVLRLVADGRDTGEIAVELSYSERTVKNTIYGVTSRFNLRNRSHAVAYVLRAGMM